MYVVASKYPLPFLKYVNVNKIVSLALGILIISST